MARASELVAYDAKGTVHKHYCLKRSNLTFKREERTLRWERRAKADVVEVKFRGHKGDVFRIGSVMCFSGVGLQNILRLLDLHPELSVESPLSTYVDEKGRKKVIHRSELTIGLRRMLTAVKVEHPEEFAIHSGRIGGATHLWEQGATVQMIQQAGRWKSEAFMKYIRNTEASAIRITNLLMKE
jgi:hypothetical protein